MSGGQGRPQPPSHVLRPEEIGRFDRGNGVVTLPATGETFEHLSDADHGAGPAS